MSHCVNIKSEAFLALVTESGMNPIALAAKMGVWMDKNNTTDWPTIEQLGSSVKSSKDKIKDISDKLRARFKNDSLYYWTIDDKNKKYKGRTFPGGVEINLAYADMATPFHEFSHPILISLRKENSIKFNNLYKTLEESPEFGLVLALAKEKVSSQYENLTEPDDIKEEILAIAIGYAASARTKNETLSSKFNAFLSRLMDWISSIFYKKQNSRMSINPIDEMTTFGEFIDKFTNDELDIILPSEWYLPFDTSIEDQNIAEEFNENLNRLAEEMDANEGFQFAGTNEEYRIASAIEAPLVEAINNIQETIEQELTDIAEDVVSKKNNILLEQKKMLDDLYDEFNEIALDSDTNDLLKSKLKVPKRKEYIPRDRDRFLSAFNIYNYSNDDAQLSDIGDDIEITSKFLDSLRANPNGSTSLEAEFHFSSMSTQEKEAMVEFRENLIDETTKWAEENSKEAPKKIKNSRLEKKLISFIKEKYPFKTIETSQKEVPYGLSSVLNKNYIEKHKIKTTGSEVLISNGFLSNAMHTYVIPGFTGGPKNSLGWFIKFHFGDEVLMYEMQSDFADETTRLNFGDNSVDITMNSILKGASSNAARTTGFLLNRLGLQPQSNLILESKIGYIEPRIEKLEHKRASMVKAIDDIGFDLSRYSKSQIKVGFNIMRGYINEKRIENIKKFFLSNEKIQKISTVEEMLRLRTELSNLIRNRNAIRSFDGSDLFELNRLKAEVNKYKFLLTRWKSVYDNGNGFENENNLIHKYFSIIEKRMTIAAIESLYNESEYVRDENQENRITKDTKAANTSWFFKSTLVALNYAKAMGKDHVYLPTASFMKMAGDASTPYVTDTEVGLNSKWDKKGGVFRALEKIKGISYKLENIPQFNATVIRVDLSEFNVKPVERFDKADSAPQSVPLQKDPLRYKFYKLLDSKNQIRSFKNDAIARERISELRIMYPEQTFSLSQNGKHQILLTAVPNEKKSISEEYRWWGSLNKEERESERQRRSQEDNESKNDNNFARTLQSFEEGSNTSEMIDVEAPRSFTTAFKSLFNTIASIKIKGPQNEANELKTVLYKFAEGISKRTGVEFEVITQEAVKDRFPEEYDRLFPKEGSRSAGFYDHENHKAYLVDGLYGKGGAIHEIFGHPFVYMLRSNIATKYIYDGLLAEAMADNSISGRIAKEYKGDTPTTINDEMVLRLLDIQNKKTIRKSEGALFIFYKAFTEFIKDVFGIKDKSISIVRGDITIGEISDWLIWGAGKLELLNQPETTNEVEWMVENIKKTAIGTNFIRIGQSVSIESLLTETGLSEETVRFVSDWYHENLPYNLGEFLDGMNDVLNGVNRNKDLSLREREMIAMQKLSPSEEAMKDANNILFNITDGIKSRLRALEIQKAPREDRNKLKLFLNEISKLSQQEAILSFIDLSKEQVNLADNQLAELVKEQNRLDQITDKTDPEYNATVNLDSIMKIHKDFLSLFKNTSEGLSKIAEKDSNIFKNSGMTKAELDAIYHNIQFIKYQFSRLNTRYENISKKAFETKLRAEGNRYGSTSMGEYLESSQTVSEDISWLTTWLGAAAYSKNEVIRVLDIVVKRAKTKARRALLDTGFSGRITSALNKASLLGKNISVNFLNSFYEVDAKGRKLGYLESATKRGQFFADYTKFMNALQSKYGLKSFDDMPVDPIENKAFEDEKEDWLNEHVERPFLPEYYVLRKAMSVEARQLIDETNAVIRRITSVAPKVNGIMDTSQMDPSVKAELARARAEKANLSSEFNLDGSLKTPYEIELAKEILVFNKKVGENVKYKSDDIAFELAKADALKNLSKSEYNKWIKENTKMVYSSEFWDELEGAEKKGRSDAYNNLYDQKKAILRRFKNPDSMDINVSMLETIKLPNGKTAKKTIDEIDILLSKLRKGAVIVQDGAKFEDIAEIVETDEYIKRYALYEAQMASGDAAQMKSAEEWFNENHRRASNGEVIPNSYWTRLSPVNKNYIQYSVPNSNWSVLDEDSNWANNSYKKEESNWGMQPKKSLYDNTAAFEKKMKSESYAELHNVLVDIMKSSNEKYFYSENSDPYRMPQIEGNMLNSVLKSSSFVKSLAEIPKQLFLIRHDDAQYGDVINSRFRNDDSRMKFIPTKYRQMLENPAAISKDLIGIYASYLEAANEFSELNKVLPEINILMEGLENTNVRNDNDLDIERKAKGKSNILKRANTLVDTEVYGETKDPLIVNIPWTKTKFSLGKPLFAILRYVALTNLFMNKMAIMANYMSAEFSLLVEAECGINLTRTDYARASLEVAIRLPDIIQKTLLKNANNSKPVELMRYFGVASTELDKFKDISKVKAAKVLKSNFFYGPYTAGDFAIKSRMLSGMLMGVRLFENPVTKEKQFYNRHEFVTKFVNLHNGDWDMAMGLFKSCKISMYDAFETKDNQLVIKDEYKSILTEETITAFSIKANRLAAKLDGMLTASDKTAAHTNVFGTALLLHRGWMSIAIHDRLGPNIFNYEEGRMTNGLYKSALGTYKNRASKIMNHAAGLLTASMENKIKYQSREDKAIDNLTDLTSQTERRLAIKRTTNEIKYMIILGVLGSILGKASFDDGDEEDSWEYQSFLFTLRVLMELNAQYLPWETFGIIKNPTAATPLAEQVLGFLDDWTNGKASDTIQTGPYEGWQRGWMRAAKASPYKHIQQDWVNQKPKPMEKYLLNNISWFYSIPNRYVGKGIYDQAIDNRPDFLPRDMEQIPTWEEMNK